MWFLVDLVLWIEHIVFAIFIITVIHIWNSEGVEGLARHILQALRSVPVLNNLLLSVLSSEVRSFTDKVKSASKDGGKPPAIAIPEKGVPREQLMKLVADLKAADANPDDGKMFALVYTAGSDTFEMQTKAFKMFSESTGLSPEHDRLVQYFHEAFMHENALNPIMFPSLRKFETEVVSMTAAMLNGDDQVVGSLTSGGTESILMAMKVYRDRARKLWPHIRDPEMVAPVSIHPAHHKAAHYFGFKIKCVPVDKTTYLPNVQDMEKAIGPNTIALLSSAPQYCQGIVDPVEEISQLAEKHGLPLHVDACFGGFMLPWVEKLGYPMPKFDFRLSGVTSMSADIHKYGYGAKGASVVLYRNDELRKYQFFAYSLWPGGLFASPTMAGTRPGGNIAAAWVALQAMGQDGYMDMADKLMKVTQKLTAEINSIPGVKVLGKPNMTAFSIGSDDPEISLLALADVLEKKGWKPERQQYPDSMHCSIMPHHIEVADQLVKDVKDAVDEVRANKSLADEGTAAMYGMVGKLPDKTIVDDFVIQVFSDLYKP